MDPDKTKDEKRVLFVGDSFCVGVVDYRYNFIKMFEDSLGYEVVNLSQPGFSPKDYLKLLEKYFERILLDYEKIFFKTISLISKTKNFGVFKKEILRKNNATGLLLRSCGIKFDLRKNAPYEMYKRVDFPIYNFEISDLYNRILSLYLEIKNSITIIKSSLKLLNETSDENIWRL